MSWTDRKALEVINKLRDEFKIRHFIETGTFKGINADVQSRNFDYVFTCDIDKESLNLAAKRLTNNINTYIMMGHSPAVINIARTFYEKNSRQDTLMFYLDAHFYNPNLPKDKRFVVLDELDSLQGFRNCIIAIHDFDNGQLGHITYDGISLDMKLLRDKLTAVNPHFRFYTNTSEGCDIFTDDTIKELGIEVDNTVLDNLAYAWSSPEKTKRGILYAVPRELDLTKYEGLREIQ